MQKDVVIMRYFMCQKILLKYNNYKIKIDVLKSIKKC